VNNLIARAEFKANLIGILILLFFFLAIYAGSSADFTNSVTVAWDPNPEPDITGYFVRWGETGGSTNVSPAGMNTTNEIILPKFATEYFFFVTASNLYLESDPSTVLTYTTMDEIVPPSPPKTVRTTFRLMSALTVSEPFTEQAQLVWIEQIPAKFYLAEAKGITIETNDSIPQLVEPPLPE